MRLLRALLAAVLLALPVVAGAAPAVTLEGGTCTTDTGVTPNTSASFTPAANEQIFVVVTATSTTQDPATLTSSLGGGTTFTQTEATFHSAGSHGLYTFVSDAFATASAQTVTFDTASDQATGTVICVYTITELAAAGVSSVVKDAENNQGAGNTPTATFGSAVSTENPTIVAAANLSNPAGVTEPTGWTEGADVGYTTPDTGLEVAHRNSGFTGTTVTWGSSSATAYAAIITEFDATDVGSPAAFDSAPTVSAETTSVYTLSYNADANSVTFFAVAMVKDASAPADCNAVEAGTGAVATASEAVTGGADTTDLTISGGDPFPLYDLYGCVEGAGGDSSVTALVDETLDVPSGRQYVVKSGSPGVGEDGIVDGASPAAADGDYIDGPVACDSFAEGAAANALTINADTTYLIDTDGDTSRQTCTRRFYDVSVADWSDASAVALYVNNQVPEYIGLDDLGGSIDPYLFQKDEDFDIAVTLLFDDGEDDAMTLDITNNPTGGSVTGGNTWSGPFTTCGSTASVTFDATDIALDTGQGIETVKVGELVPDVVGDDEATAVTALETPCSFTATQSGTAYSASVPAGSVISTDPAAGELVPPDQNILYLLSLGQAQAASERKIVFVITDLTGLTRWVDYIPVGEVPGCIPGRYDNDGCWAVDAISSTAGLTAWVDYTPVGEVSQTANKWRYENDGWIPVDTLTP